ncbi:ATP-binding protein [Streptomyces xantholiticus]|uniref:ATP-binding protein n=1 Tax=Streptomyces xantholiticus TaxID=68285 RepID=A0ABV1UN57_9ACTN
MPSLHQHRRRPPSTAPDRQVQRSEASHAIAVCTLPAEEWAVPRARSFTKGHLTAWRIGDEVAEAARLVVSELVTNTVRHSGSAEVRLRLARSRTQVRIEVVDSGRWRPPAPPPRCGDMAEGGRGFDLVDAVARRYGVHSTPSGTCAWALLPESSLSGGPRAAAH